VRWGKKKTHLQKKWGRVHEGGAPTEDKKIDERAKSISKGAGKNFKNGSGGGTGRRVNEKKEGGSN